MTYNEYLDLRQEREDVFEKGLGNAERLQYCNIAKAEVGKWYKFDMIGDITGYGKVIGFIEEDNSVVVEKYFELPNYRPYVTTKWFDKLPYAI